MTEPNLENEELPPEEKDEATLETEAKARRMGWRPKDEYSGPIHKWVEAAVFVARGEQELPILRERLRKFDDRLASTERELTGARTELKDARTKITEQSEVLTELRDLSLTAAQRGYQRAQGEIAERQRRAVQEADTVTFDRLEREKRELEESRPVVRLREEKKPDEVRAAPRDTAPALSNDEAATITSWISDNPWYNADPEMNAVATSLHGLIRQQNPTMGLVENLAEVKSRIVNRYPEKFGETRRRPAAVAASSAPPPRSTKKTVNDLPADAKDALARFKRSIPDYKDEDYLKMYFSEEA